MLQVLFVVTIYGISLLATPVFFQDRFEYEFKKLAQPKDVPHFEVALNNTASEFEDESRLIFILKVVNDELQFIKSRGKKFQADYDLTVTLFDTSGEETSRKTHSGKIIAQNFDEVNSLELYDITGLYFDVSPDRYNFKIELYDKETRRTGTQEGFVVLRDFSKPEVMFSEVIVVDSVIIAQKIEQDFLTDVADLKLKGSNYYAYFEIYNVPEKDSVQIKYEIVDSKDQILDTGDKLVLSRGRITAVYLELENSGSVNKKNRIKILTQTKASSFSAEQNINCFCESSFSAFENLAESIEPLVYIAKKDEFKKLKQAQGEEQINLFKAFWAKRDPTPDTPRNEYFDEYYQRVEFANKRFTQNKDGWRTEMGMIYILLGAPDYIEEANYYDRFADPIALRKPALVWQYLSLRRRVVFTYKAGEYRIANYNEIFDLLNDEMRF